MLRSLGGSCPLEVCLLAWTIFEQMEDVVNFNTLCSWGLIFGSRKSKLYSINFSARESICRASSCSMGRLSEDTDGRQLRRLTSSLLPALSLFLSRPFPTDSFSSKYSSFFPQFSRARSGGMPVPPLSMDQGALPAGHGYSYCYNTTFQYCPPPLWTLPHHSSSS